MDRQLRTALRSIRASGNTSKLMEHLLEDASIDTLLDAESIVNRVKKAYRGKQILRALTAPKETLKSFKLEIDGPQGHEWMHIQSCIRNDLEIVFKGILNVKTAEPKTFTTSTLYDDRMYSFGLKNLSTSIAVMMDDVLKITYTLAMEDK